MYVDFSQSVHILNVMPFFVITRNRHGHQQSEVKPQSPGQQTDQSERQEDGDSLCLREQEEVRTGEHRNDPVSSVRGTGPEGQRTRRKYRIHGDDSEAHGCMRTRLCAPARPPSDMQYHSRGGYPSRSPAWSWTASFSDMVCVRSIPLPGTFQAIVTGVLK